MALSDYLKNEVGFQDFYNKTAKANGLDLNPDDPRHGYDYRAAYNNFGPERLQEMFDESGGHWPSEFKKAGNERMVLGGVDTQTGLAVPEYKRKISDYLLDKIESLKYGQPQVGVLGFK